MTGNFISQSEITEVLREHVLAAGSQTAFAKAHNLSRPYVTDLLAGNRFPGDKVLDILGLEKIVVYRPKNGAEKPLQKSDR